MAVTKVSDLTEATSLAATDLFLIAQEDTASKKVTFANLVPGAWTAYTPSWVASGTQPAIGNGTLSGRFLLYGKLCFFVINVLMGSTTTYGTGTYDFGLPSGAVGRTTGGLDQPVSLFGFDSGAAFRTGLGVVTAGGSVVTQLVNDGTATAWGQLVPQTWANGDAIRIIGIIEID